MQPIVKLVIAGTAMFATLGLIAGLSGMYSLNIKAKTVGHGQHGTARWATKGEIKKTYVHVPFEPELWRKGKHLPTEQGIVVGCLTKRHRLGNSLRAVWNVLVVKLLRKSHVLPKSADETTALVDTGDVHALMIGAAGVGKTSYWLYPCLEYALASGMSFLSTDTKGDVVRNYGRIAQECYGYRVGVIDLRNPTKSDGFNLLHLVNKYMDAYREHPDTLLYKAKAERYAKITAKTIVTSGLENADFGQNQYFFDAAEGILTASILLVAEFCPPGERHIVSVFKIIQELMAPVPGEKGRNQFQDLMALLPPTHKARWFAGAAISTAEQSMASVMSTALSRLNRFLDSEMEQLLCFDTAVDAETFCKEPSALFLVMPEEDPSKFFMVSLIIQQLYREILSVADENGGKLPNRAVFYCDEYGTLPKIESAEMMFSASRSRRLSIVPIIQSIGQLEKNYGKEGAEIIIDNTQDTIFGGFAPNSQTAEVMSKSLGSRTAQTGYISKGKESSQSLQMIERPLMTPDELKSMPKGEFIVMKTGAHPRKVKLKLFFEWGITFGEPYMVPDKGNRPVPYAGKETLIQAILEKYPPAPIVAEVEDESQENSSGQQASAAASPKSGQKQGKKQGQQQKNQAAGKGRKVNATQPNNNKKQETRKEREDDRP